MLSTNIILLVVVIIGLMYLYMNFREGYATSWARGSKTPNFAGFELTFTNPMYDIGDKVPPHYKCWVCEPGAIGGGASVQLGSGWGFCNGEGEVGEPTGCQPKDETKSMGQTAFCWGVGSDTFLHPPGCGPAATAAANKKWPGVPECNFDTSQEKWAPPPIISYAGDPAELTVCNVADYQDRGFNTLKCKMPTCKTCSDVYPNGCPAGQIINQDLGMYVFGRSAPFQEGELTEDKWKTIQCNQIDYPDATSDTERCTGGAGFPGCCIPTPLCEDCGDMKQLIPVGQVCPNAENPAAKGEPCSKNSGNCWCEGCCGSPPPPKCTTNCVSTNGSCGIGTLVGTGTGCPATEPACNGPPCPCDDKRFSCNTNQTLNKSTYDGTQVNFFAKCCDSPPPTACKDTDCPASQGWFRNTNIKDCPYVTGQTSCPASICCVQKTCKDADPSVCGKGKTKGGGDIWCKGLNDCTNCCIDNPPKQTCKDWLNINNCARGYIPNKDDHKSVCGCDLDCGHGKPDEDSCTCTCDEAIAPWGPWTKDIDGQCTVPPKPAWVKPVPASCPSVCSFYGTPPKDKTIENPWVCETWDKKKTSNCTAPRPANDAATLCPVSAIITPNNCCEIGCKNANCSSVGDCDCGKCPTTGHWVCSTDNKCICQQGWEGANCDK